MIGSQVPTEDASSLLRERIHYRPDVDGLRAIAVLLVVSYHYQIWPWTGGFVGVDVFFVISGYLISSIIYPEILEHRFSILEFYSRRIRRIFPALGATLLFTAIASVFVLFPLDLMNFGKSLFATALFSSNFEFWREAGYFDTSALSKPLLHTWSLAVEEQFYLFFPPLLLLARSTKRMELPVSIVATLCLVSLAVSFLAVRFSPTNAFYLLPGRAWEPLLGACLLIVNLPTPNKTLANLFGVTGLLALAWAALLYTKTTPFPGPNALLPCVGTALLIFAGTNKSSIVNSFLSVRPLVICGLISYSLYLWHWPLLVFATYLSPAGLGTFSKALLIATSILLAFTSWRFIERPFRGRSAILSRSELFGVASVATFSALAVGLVLVLTRGMPSRYPPDLQRILVAMSDHPKPQNCQLRTSLKVCVVGPHSTKEPAMLFWGDSIANSMLPAINAALAQKRQNAYFLEQSGCAPLTGIGRSDAPECLKFNADALALAVHSKVRTVILISRWAFNAEGTRYGDEPGDSIALFDARHQVSTTNIHRLFELGLTRTVRELKNAGKNVVLIASIPEIGHSVPSLLATERILGETESTGPSRAEFSTRQRFVNHTIERLHARFGVTVIYPSFILCKKSCALELDGHPLYSDNHHLSNYGANLIEPLLVKAISG